MKRDHWGEPDVGRRIILRWILKNQDVGIWTGLGRFRIETGGRHL
jgi:hypothetical protein